jgi:hypothetical protein
MTDVNRSLAAPDDAPSDPAATVPRPRANLTARALSAVVGLPILFFFSFVGGPPEVAGLPFACGVAVCALIGGFEFFRAARKRGYRPSEAMFVCFFCRSASGPSFGGKGRWFSGSRSPFSSSGR